MIWRTLHHFFAILGIICLVSAGYLFWQRTNPYRLSFASYSELPAVKAPENLRPVNIRIPSLSIDLPISAATIENGKWPASSTGISHLSSSPVPGEQGNSTLYGHNWPNLLGPLKKIQPGDSIEIGLSDGTTRTFVVSRTDTVTPDQTKSISQTGETRITLYTCAGFLDRKRFIVTGSMPSAASIL